MAALLSPLALVDKTSTRSSTAGFGPQGGPRERLWTQGAQNLSDAELIAILLGTGHRGASVMQVAQSLVQNHSLIDLARSPAAKLGRFAGLGQAKAARLIAAFELGQRALSAPLMRGQQLSSPEQVAAYYGPRLSGGAERFVVVHLDNRQRILSENQLAQGGADRCPVPVRELLSGALEAGAAAIICVHNHPSGDPSPSPEDRALTQRLDQACTLVGLQLLDHVVVAGSRHTSLRGMGGVGVKRKKGGKTNREKPIHTNRCSHH